jgi:ribosomal silencing factor RsfS
MTRKDEDRLIEELCEKIKFIKKEVFSLNDLVRQMADIDHQVIETFVANRHLNAIYDSVKNEIEEMERQCCNIGRTRPP